MPKIRKVLAINPPPESTVVVTSRTKGKKALKNPTKRLWAGGLCRVEGDVAYPIISQNPDVLVLKDQEA